MMLFPYEKRERVLDVCWYFHLQEQTFYDKSLSVFFCFFLIRPSPFFFRLPSNAFPELGRSVGMKKKALKKAFSESEAWYPSIIAVEPGKQLNKT